MAGTADTIPDLTNLDKAAQLAALRRSMAAIPGRRDHAPTDSDDSPAFAPSQPKAQAAASGGDERALSGPGRSRTLKTLPVPKPLSELLPRGALARGTALSITGAGSILVGLVATATAAGHHVALIGQPKFGMLAVHEHGGDLSKIALIDPGQADPLDAANICIDGIDLVISTVHGRDVPPTRARALLARNRTYAGILAITDGRMPGLDMTISSRPVGYGGIEQGRGRIRSITLEATVHGRGITQRTGRYTLTAPTFGEHGVRWVPTSADATPVHRPHRLAVAQ
nr:hypothetical protein [uncultured Rhodococcus sp.]